jgi:hypothetical protein
MSFVDCYLPYFRHWLITHLLWALLPFQPLFTEGSLTDQLLVPPCFSSALSATPPLCCVLVFNSLFIVQFSLFAGEGQFAQGLCWFILGVDGVNCVMLGTHLLVCQMSPKQVWSQCLAAQQRSCFLSVTWCGDAFCRLGVQDVEVLILLAASFPPSVAPVSQQSFGVSELMLSASAP